MLNVVSDQQKKEINEIVIKWLKSTYIRSEDAKHYVSSKEIQRKISVHLESYGLSYEVKGFYFGFLMMNAFGRLPYVRKGPTSIPYYGNLRRREAHDETIEEGQISSNKVS